MRRSAEIEDGGETFDAEASGLMFGGGVGLLVAMTPMASLDAGVHFDNAGYDDVEVDGQSIDDTDGRTSMLAMRIGIAYGFGSR